MRVSRLVRSTVLAGHLLATTHALLLNTNNFLDKLKGERPREVAAPPSGDALLQQMNLTASYEPRAFSVEPQNVLGVVGATLPAVFRLGSGVLAEGYQLQVVPRNPSKYTLLAVGDYQLEESSTNKSPRTTTTRAPLIVWDREGSVACRWVREACSILSLTVQIRPSPQRGLEFTSRLSNQQRKQLPLLEDPNTGISFGSPATASNVVEPQAILNYLFKTYGNGQVPPLLQDKPWNRVVTTIALATRLGGGSRYATSDPPPLPLQLWTYETSPFGKLVTECLGRYELEYVVTYCPRGSPNRQELFMETGRVQVPFLKDPNTGVQLWESAAICEYLEKRYAARAPVAYV